MIDAVSSSSSVDGVLKSAEERHTDLLWRLHQTVRVSKDGDIERGVKVEPHAGVRVSVSGRMGA
jgi:hypothetical protein